jgi:hypothetical protein
MNMVDAQAQFMRPVAGSYPKHQIRNSSAKAPSPVPAGGTSSRAPRTIS